MNGIIKIMIFKNCMLQYCYKQNINKKYPLLAVLHRYLFESLVHLQQSGHLQEPRGTPEVTVKDKVKCPRHEVQLVPIPKQFLHGAVHPIQTTPDLKKPSKHLMHPALSHCKQLDGHTH